MWHPTPGTSGLILGPTIFFFVGAGSYFTKEFERYNLEPGDIKGAFEPFLVKYLRVAEFIIGLATGSIVLLVGSSALHGSTGHLPWFYATPLVMLGWCVLFGLGFMVWLILNYEEHQHGNPHTKRGYALSETLGFSSLACFCVGYFWLITSVTR